MHGSTSKYFLKHLIYEIFWRVCRYDLSADDNYFQAGILYRKVLSEAEQKRLVENLTDSLKCAADFLQVLRFYFFKFFFIQILFFIFLSRKKLSIILPRLTMV